LLDGTQEVFYRIYHDADRRLRRAQSNVAIVSVSPRFIVEALGMAFIAAMAYILATRPSGLYSAIPIIGTLALAAQRMLPLMQQVYASWSSMRGGQYGLSDALIFLDQPLPEQVDTSRLPAMPFTKAITLKDLSFRYSESGPWVLAQINLCIQKGSRIGFIGSTGSGKSTLLDIVMGLLSPTQGTLNLDGITITTKNCSAFQSHIAHVPQSIFLADTSIAENIAFGVPASDIDLEQVRLAAQRAQIAGSIENWRLGYSTVVGERGVRLSGGQRQRIGIARALYKQADLIVFDEATSALDGDTEWAVMDSIKHLDNDLTILIVAHRLTTLRDCTQIVELKNGKVVQIGTYEEVIGQKKVENIK
jgi:ATP-binding cassette subfamily B protein